MSLSTPGDFIFDRNRRDRRVRGCLFSAAQDTFTARMIQVHFAFDHRDARALGAVVNGKHCAGNRNERITSVDEQMPLALFRGFDNDRAAVQVNRGALANC